jgi:hypothetical protein
MPLSPSLVLLSALSLAAGPPAPAVLPLLSQAMQSPWWENYDQKDRYLCPNRSSLVLERNASQASLIGGGGQVILFREETDAPGVLYRNGAMRVILQGDQLTFERLPMRLVCLRTEQA